MPRGGYYFDDVSFNRGDQIDPQKFRPVSDIPDEHLAVLSEYGRALYRNTDYALLGWGFGVCFLGLSLITDRTSNVTQGLTDEWMMMLMTEKETCHEMMDRSVEATIQCLKLLHEAVGDYVFAWGIAADDSGTQRGEFIRPELWAEMIKPHYQKVCDWIHAHTPWKVFLHCCGSVYNLIPHFIEAGIDILNPVQTSAANMDPARLKQQFGGRLVFWGGGCDTQRVLGSAAPEEIRGTYRSGSRSSAPAAATCSIKSITSRRTCRRRTSSQCSRRLTSSGLTLRRTDRCHMCNKVCLGIVFHGVLQDSAGPVPAALTRLTDDWQRLVVPFRSSRLDNTLRTEGPERHDSHDPHHHCHLGVVAWAAGLSRRVPRASRTRRGSFPGLRRPVRHCPIAYQLQVNGTPVPVYACRVSAVPFNQVWPGYQRPLDQTEMAAFASWDMEGPVRIEVQSQHACSRWSCGRHHLAFSP